MKIPPSKIQIFSRTFALTLFLLITFIVLILEERYSRLFHYLISLPISTWIAILLAWGIGGLELKSAQWIKEEESTHPAYRVEKQIWGAVFVGSGVNLLIGVSAAAIYFRIFSNSLLIFAAILSFLFIRYRKNNPLFRVIRLRTQVGVKISGSMKENNAKVTEAAALIRHHLSGGGTPLLSEWALEEMKDAIGSPTVAEWTSRERERRNLELRRDALSDVGDTVDIPERNLDNA